MRGFGRKFKVTDDEGSNFLVEEVSDDFVEEKEEITDDDEFVSEEQLMDDEPIEGEGEEIHDDDASLTPEEIGALKQLASVAGKIMALISTGDSEEEEEPVGDEDEEEEPIGDDEPIDGEEEPIGDEFEEEKEEIIDTDNVKDSFGAIEKKSKAAKDSADDLQDEIARKWSEHYKQKA